MNHPILSNKKTILIYSIFWFVIGVVHSHVLFRYYSFSWIISMFDAFLFNTLFALIALGLWYAVKYNGTDFKKPYSLFFSHSITAIVVVMVWFFIGQTIINFIVNNTNYTAFLRFSSAYRLIIGFTFYIGTIMFYYLIVYYNSLQEQVKKEAFLVSTLKESELQILRSQINPHFLFNSLNSISSLTITEPTKARDMIIKLSDFMRYSLKNKDNRMVELSEELMNIENYMDIERIRFGNRIQFQQNITAQAMKAFVPSMIFQPLAENSIKHGVFSSSENVKVWLNADVKDDLLVITLKNEYEESNKSETGTGTGLSNIKRRMQLLFGSEDFVRIRIENNIFEVQISVPQNNNKENSF
ncbi:MAG: histidine kinase [Bacteroidota bacterium]